MKENFWDDSLFDESYKQTYSYVEDASYKSLTKMAMQQYKVVHAATVSGTPLKTQEQFFEFIVNSGGRIVSKSDGYESDEFKFNNSKFVWENTYVGIDAYSNKSLHIKIYSLDEKLKVKLTEFFKESVTADDKGKVYTFIIENSVLKLSRMAKITGVPVIKENYNDSVIHDYEHIIKDVVSNDPCGRISILDGIPGTGKTHLVRGMINDVKEALWVLIPSNMITEMMKPEFIPVLSNTRAAWKKEMPFVFVLEDADSCLVPRAADNMSSISNVLNFADGIFGNLFDIRIVATTNAKVVEVDPAIMRAGRLCKRVDVGALSRKEANRALDNILKDYKQPYANLEEKSYTLADVYQIARRIKNKTTDEVRSTVIDVPKKGFGFKV